MRNTIKGLSMHHHPKSQPKFFAFLMLLSGLAGISYEILYGRILGNMVGDQFAVSAAILMTFLLGIGIGSAYAHRLWRWLWAIEAGIGIYGVLIAFSQPLIERVVYAGSSLFTDNLTASILICVLLLIVPTFLIGCSVPLFAGYFGRESALQSRASFSRVYMVYNLGAALTALLIEFYLIRSLGVRASVALFAALNLVIAAGLWVRFSHLREVPKQQAGQSFVIGHVLRQIPASRWLALMLASMASAIFQLFMVKYSELVFGPFRESFALVLSLILIGIALGSMLAQRFALSFTHLMWLNLVGLLGLMLLAGPAIYVYAALYELVGSYFWGLITLKWLLLSGLMMVPAMTFGAAIPTLLSLPGEAAKEQEVSRESGALLLISSLANVAGFLLMAFVLHRLLDYGVQLLIIGGIAALALAVYTRGRLRHVIPAALVVLAMFGWQHNKWDENLLYLSYTSFRNVKELKTERANFGFPDRYKGYQDVFSINWMDGKPYFFINGYVSISLSNPAEKIVGALSSLFSPRLDEALVLGLGSGATASAVGLFFKHTEVVEINPVVRENLFRMAQWNYDIEHNPRVDIVVDDAIHHVKVGDNKYSMILSTVTTPLYFSSSKLYTRDFFDSINKRLTPDGVYITWMDSRIGDAGTDIILRTLKKTFKHCAILYVKSAYFLLVASNQPLRVQQAAAISNQPELSADLMTKHGVMAAWLPYHLMHTDVYGLIDNPQGELNTADYPALEFEMALRHNRSIYQFSKRLRDAFNIDDMKRALGPVGAAFPADFLAQSEERLGNSPITERWKKVLAGTPELQNKAKLAELDWRLSRARIEDSVGAWYAVGVQMTRMQRHQQAIEVFNKVLKMDPMHNNANYYLGTSLEDLGRTDEALKSFQAEQQLDPKDKDVDYRIGRLLLRAGRHQQALEVLNRYIETWRPSDSMAYSYRAMAHRALGHKELARIDIKRALNLQGGDQNIFDQVGL
ncbi:MAG: tetratricopeptide repeat protein [Rhodoferax sp.]|nr:tetratricopeptide repeat protein [Rhodoferax sp.]